MAMHRFLLAAQEASTFEEVPGNGLFDLARAHEIQELLFVQRPIAVFLLFIGI